MFLFALWRHLVSKKFSQMSLESIPVWFGKVYEGSVSGLLFHDLAFELNDDREMIEA